MNPRAHETVSPGDDAQICVAGRNIVKASTQRPDTFRDIVLHANGLMSHAAKDVQDRKSVPLKVAVRRGDIDFHGSPRLD